MGKKLIWFLFRFLILALCCFLSSDAASANKASMSDGNIIFKTSDTKATSNIRWMTAGFSIRKDKSFGNPIKDNKYAVIVLKSNYQKTEEKGGIYHITYTIPKKRVDRALLAAGLDGIENGDTLYFNTIFQIKVYGVVQGKQYYRLKDIKNAAGWRNPNDFNEHFDIAIKFKSAKYSVTVEYRDYFNKVLKEKKLNDKKAGKEVSVTLDGEKSFDGTEYILFKSYYIDLSRPAKKKNVIKAAKDDYGESQIQSGKVRIGGMKIVACMKKKPEKKKKITAEKGEKEGEPPVPVETIEEQIGLDEIEAAAELKAEEKGNEKYDVGIAIPSGELLYAQGKADSALLEYKFTKYEGSVVYAVRVNASYTLRWQEKSGNNWVWNSRKVNDSRIVYVEREYSYWTVDYFNYYSAEKMEIKNDVLSSGKVTMEYSPEDVTYQYHASKHEYPLSKDVTIDMGNYVQTVSGSNVPPSYLDYENIAKEQIGEIKTKNDYLEYNGEIVLDDKECRESTSDPDIPEKSEEKAEFCKRGLVIPEEKKNEEYKSTGYVYYKNRINAVENAFSEDTENMAQELIVGVDEINSVWVHTPVVCNGQVTDQSYLCQSVNPNPARCQLILDTEFSVSISCYGEHLPYKGYGTQDYSRFCRSMEVSFPFDVYSGGSLRPAGSWSSISSVQTFYLPIWVEEGEYMISFRTTAKNGTEPAMDGANLDPAYYAAEAGVPVEVSGRMYGLKNYDITDYPLWKNVFREENSSQLSGTAYYVGTKNQNGADTGLKTGYTLPVLAGSHPYYENTGYLKAGYVMRCSLKTIGSFFRENDGIEIETEFYFVDKNGENRERVDLYYDESVSGKYQKLIKVGSERDQLNEKILSLGKDGMSVPEQEIKDTAFIKNIKAEDLKKQEITWNGYQKLFLPLQLQTFSGESHMLGRGLTVSLDRKEKAMRSKQNWYFEYYLPASYHIVSYGYDVDGYAKEYPIDFTENFWKKEGFLIVQLHIYANRQEKRALSYLNEDNAERGYCNMWKTEGFLYDRIDENGIRFHLQDGDFAVFYYGNKQSDSAGDDYASGGTH